MSEHPYTTLGVQPDVSDADLRKAYRKLAKKLHPDLNPGNKQAEEKFKEVATAYDLLSDPTKRALFDQGEIDASGNERPRHRYYRDYAEGEANNAYSNPADVSDDDLFARMFGRSRGRSTNEKGEDALYRLELDFLEAFNGGSKTLTLPGGSVLDVTIPPGTRGGQTLRLRGKGGYGRGTGPAGDALIEIEVRPHATFQLKGDDIYIDLPVSLADAVLGGKVEVPTPSGTVTMSVPKWSNTGAILRLRGKGLPRIGGAAGDEYVTLKLMLPEKPDADLQDFMSRWGNNASSNSPQAEKAGR